MTALRRKRLLLLTLRSGAHKRRYPEYLELQREGLVTWSFGMALLKEEYGEDLGK